MTPMTPGFAIPSGIALALAASALAGCAGATPAASHAETTQSDASELVGEWVEYWSLVGAAETQRYSFLANGEFVWAAAPSGSAPAAGTPLRKMGSYALRQDAHGRVVVLQVASTDLAGCDSACDAEQARNFHVEHRPSLREEIELGECSQNLEAQHLDEHYRCLALGEHAFWRKP